MRYEREGEIMYKYVILFFASALIAFLITPVVKRIAYTAGAVDIPKDNRRIHKKPILRMGGLAIYIPFVIITLIKLGNDRQVLGIILGGTLIAAMGAVDDIRPLKPVIKLTVQIIAAIILILFGISVKSITIPFMSSNASATTGILCIPITIIWVVGITNAINLIDGLDGLACGISMISSLALMYVAYLCGRETPLLLNVILSGACLGFLPFNFNPASIFMGDTGSQFLGFTLASVSMLGAIKSTTAVVVAVPILAIGIPIYDTLFAMLRRKLNNKPMMEADRGHMHHRLLDMGFNQKQVVLIMYAVSILLGLASIAAIKLTSRRSYELLMFVCAFVIATAIEFGLFSKKDNKNADKEDRSA